MEIDEIRDKFDELEQGIGDLENDCSTLRDMIVVIADAILEQQSHGHVSPVTLAKVTNILKYNKKR